MHCMFKYRNARMQNVHVCSLIVYDPVFSERQSNLLMSLLMGNKFD